MSSDRITVDNPEKDQRVIRQKFFDELYKRDKIANQNREPNIFTIEEVHKKCLGAFDLELVRAAVRGYSMEQDPPVEFIGNIQGDNIRLSDRGRNVCQGL